MVISTHADFAVTPYLSSKVYFINRSNISLRARLLKVQEEPLSDIKESYRQRHIDNNSDKVKHEWAILQGGIDLFSSERAIISL